MARPKIDLDWSKLDAILQYNAQLEDCAEILGVHTDTIVRRIRKEHGMTFSEYRRSKQGKVRIKLVQKAFEMAHNGSAAMMIFCLKNMCGWADKQEVEQTIKTEMPLENLTAEEKAAILIEKSKEKTKE